MSRGLVMYESLLKTCNDFHLYVFAFDEKCYQFLLSAKYDHLTVISLKEFEDDELLRVKSQRSAAEYCWTCTSSIILYSIKSFNLTDCTYVDADLYFYSDPRVLIDEMGDKSVLITEHRYTKSYDQSAVSGKYCVQFMTFKNDANGLKALNWWRSACIEWCYARAEEGKFGDQKYLDDWTVKFAGVHELRHLGGGIAPWNVQQYDFVQTGQYVNGIERITGKEFEVVFFHFHGIRFYEDDIVGYAPYPISSNVMELFYIPYTKLLNKSKAEINSIDLSFDPNGTNGKSPLPPMNFFIDVKIFIASLISGNSYKKSKSEYHIYKIKR